jgi:8-oxo-dGTP pyrophosphatase MutT (NUDIX family)
VRRPCAAGAVSFELLRLLIRDEPECNESAEEFEDIECSGGRAATESAARREFVEAAGYDLDGAVRAGEDRVKSNSSIPFSDG